jgi:hypothetical protein
MAGVVLALKVPQLAVRRQNLMSAVESLTTIASLHQTQPTIQGCRVDVSLTDVSPTESSWMLRPLDKASLGYCAPVRCVPTLDRVTHRWHNAWTAQCMGVASAKLGKLGALWAPGLTTTLLLAGLNTWTASRMPGLRPLQY